MINPELAGWLSDAEFAELRRLAEGRLVLEIGCWQGRSTVAMAATARRVFSVDHFRGDSYTGRPPVELLPACLANLRNHLVADHVCLLMGDFRDVLPVLDGSRFDLVFYDADHSGPATRWALDWIHAHVRRNALVAVHDYSDAYPHYREAKQAIDYFAALSGRTLRQVNVLAVLEPAA